MATNVDIGSKGEVISYLQQLIAVGQVKPCVHMMLEFGHAHAYYPRCEKKWASRVTARNVEIDITAYSGPSSYSWPKCPPDCPHFKQSSNFQITAARDPYDEVISKVTDLDPVVSVERICKRISLVIRQLRERHDNRSTLDVIDEYDLQDLLHALLHFFCDDVREEEYTPSYAGKATRMDFLLKNESIVIEAKMTRKGLGAKEVGEQLIVDIAHYKKHPSCKTLVCLVYDPEHRIKNARGLEVDLETSEAELKVKVFIVPSGA